jgi:two-component system LytT family response regulator
MDPSLQEIEGRVDPQQFFRISRAALISVNAVVEVNSLPGGSAVVVLKGKTQLDVSRRRVRDLLTILEQG